MRYLKILFVLCFLPFFTACGEDYNDILRIVWDQASAEVIKNGVSLGSQEQELVLRFSTGKATDVSASTDSQWIIPQVESNANGHELHISIESNEDISDRSGTIFLNSQGKSTSIKIMQKGSLKVTIEKSSYHCDADGGAIEIQATAKGGLSASIYPQNTDWAKVVRVIPQKNNKYIITLRVDKNVGLGRIASLEFSFNEGKALSEDVPIIQSPSTFPETLTIRTNKPGSLPILLGNDITNIRHIKRLTLIGGINSLDFPALKYLFMDSPESISEYPIELDLSEAVFTGGNSNPFRYYGWKPEGMDNELISINDELPSVFFENAYNLRSIKLPNSLKVIGVSAFSGCRNLQQIDIPNSVERISSKAFWDCSNLKQINISRSSNLTYIGNQAFTTNSWLDELYIPISTVNISVAAFLGCKVKKLHLNWPDHPVKVNIIPKSKGAILYVPRGTTELYKNTPNWFRFEKIVEE